MKRTLIFTVLCVLLSGCIMDRWHTFKMSEITVDYQEQTVTFELDEKKEISFYLSTAITDDSTFFAHENGRFNDYIIGEWFKIEKKGNDIFVWVSENDKKNKKEFTNRMHRSFHPTGRTSSIAKMIGLTMYGRRKIKITSYFCRRKNF